MVYLFLFVLSPETPFSLPIGNGYGATWKWDWRQRFYGHKSNDKEYGKWTDAVFSVMSSNFKLLHGFWPFNLERSILLDFCLLVIVNILSFTYVLILSFREFYYWYLYSSGKQLNHYLSLYSWYILPQEIILVGSVHCSYLEQ